MEGTVLKSLERLYMTTVLDHCLDQMSVLSHLQLPSKDRAFSPEEGLGAMNDEDIEELQESRKENESLHVWQKTTTNLDRPTVLLNAMIAIIWNKMILFKNLSIIGKGHKLQEFLIKAVRNEVANKGTFSCMTTVISDHRLRKKSERIIELTFITAKRVAELCHQHEELELEYRQDSQKYTEIEGVLKISNERLQYKADNESKREKKSSDAHEEQELKKMVISESDLVEELNSIKSAQSEEPKLTKTVSMYLNKRLAELEEMLEYWMEQYETQLEDKQKRLEKVRLNRMRLWDVTFKLLLNFSNVAKIVENSHREKLKEEIRSNRELKTKHAAVKIQAWWRGLMVRMHLGPYRAKPGKGDKKGKKS